MIAADTFRFLNREERVSTAADWNNAQRELLWSCNLHYFDDLCAAGAAERADRHGALIARWIEENPAGHGCGWESYPLSLRIVNWIKWALAGGAVNPRATAEEDLVGRGFSAPTAPIPFEEIMEVSRVAIEAAESPRGSEPQV